MSSGRFIVLDGLDGSGKATQSRLLAERLNAEGRPARKMDFPAYDRNFFGSLIGECLAGKRGDFVNLDPKIASTLYACDRAESAEEIRRALSNGETIVADRFTSSNQIHQGGKIEDDAERQVFLTWLDRMEHEVLRVPRPDLVLYLRVPLEVSLDLLARERSVKNEAQGGGVDTVEADMRYMEHSFSSAEMLAERNENWKAIECVWDGVIRTREEIHEDIWSILKGL
ncbi:MAG: dTMP kinase [Parcubacteria bacterium C7867-004]|nr:MAG: dTMP kinase [Parcubacteria bacterium C7867-004]